MAIHIQDSDDLKTRLEEAGEKLVTIAFMGTCCGPCKKIGPIVDNLAKEMADSVVFLKVNVDSCGDIDMEYHVKAMPTFVFIKNSHELEHFSGPHVDKLQSTILKLK